MRLDHDPAVPTAEAQGSECSTCEARTVAISDRDRAFLDASFARYGTAWAGGLAALERDFEVEARKTWTHYVLDLTLRAPPKVCVTLHVQCPGGQISQPPMRLPDGDELGTYDRASVDAILAAERRLWFVEPMNGCVIAMPIERGLADLQGRPRAARSRTRQGLDDMKLVTTRRLGDRAILYFQQDSGATACLTIELAIGAIEDLVWVEVPMREPARYLREQDRAWLDRALRAHGDFGVYGDVTPGLDWLVENFDVQLRDRGEHYDVSVTPRDGHGHWLHFAIVKASGAIEGAAAGHHVPRPD